MMTGPSISSDSQSIDPRRNIQQGIVALLLSKVAASDCSQMKIALLFLACLVGISCHQQYIWPYPQLARYYPMVYANDHRYVIVNPEVFQCLRVSQSQVQL